MISAIPFHMIAGLSNSEMATLTLVVGLFFTVIWIVIGWRAMRAHERIADAITDFVRLKQTGKTDAQLREEAYERRQARLRVEKEPPHAD